ncbi:hypothetical protein Trydic_g1724 [Trypoxylus dichotomus]
MEYTVPYTPQLNDLEKNMWGEAAFVATYLVNRCPTAGMNGTPSERWSDKKIRRYYNNCYRLGDDEKQKIMFARDVVFKETKNSDTPRKEIGLRWPINDAHYEENKNESETLDENSIEQDQENDENLIKANKENSQEVEEPMQSKRSEGMKKLPKYLEEYELDVENISCMTYEEAVTGQNRHEWLQAIEEENKSLIENNTRKEVGKQEVGEAKILNNKWLLRIKNDGRYKARLVVCGNQQEYGIDFTEIYSPVVDVSCLRILLAVAAARNYTIFDFDIKTAFLYGELEETILMNMPKGYPHADKICKLKKSLYRLKQAPLK